MQPKTKPAKKLQSIIIKSYLLAYNLIQTIGWSFLLYKLVTYYICGDMKKPLYEHVKLLVIILPNSALLEIIHAVSGMVPSSPFVTIQQVYSRVLMVCGVILPTLAAKEGIGLPLALFSWSIAEVSRYSFYALNIVNAVPYFLIWIRYSLFMVLFPLGLTGELLSIYAAQREFGITGAWALRLPNCINFTFNYQYFLIFNIFGFLVGFPKLYMHMVAQRKKVLGSSTTEKKQN